MSHSVKQWLILFIYRFHLKIALMIKKTLYFGNPAYLSLKNAQLVIKLPEVEKNDTLPELFKTQTQVTKPMIVFANAKILFRKQFTTRMSSSLEPL